MHFQFLLRPELFLGGGCLNLVAVGISIPLINVKVSYPQKVVLACLPSHPAGKGPHQQSNERATS